MGRKFKAYLDSGANIHSEYSVIVDFDKEGISSEEWDGMSEEVKEEFMKEYAWSRMDWGFYEIDGEEE